MTTKTSYTTTEVCKITGLSYRQLDYWIRTGKIRLEAGGMPGTGYSRCWSADEVRRLKYMVAIYDEAREVMAAFRSGALWTRSE